jgi:hypothetical protein
MEPTPQDARPLTKQYHLSVVVPYLELRKDNLWLAATKEHLLAFEKEVASLKDELADQEREKLELVKAALPLPFPANTPPETQEWHFCQCGDDVVLLFWGYPDDEYGSTDFEAQPTWCEYLATYDPTEHVVSAFWPRPKAVKPVSACLKDCATCEKGAQIIGPDRPETLAKLSDEALLQVAGDCEPGSDAHYDAIMEVCNRGLKDPEAGETACNFLPELKANMETRPRLGPTKPSAAPPVQGKEGADRG